MRKRGKGRREGRKDVVGGGAQEGEEEGGEREMWKGRREKERREGRGRRMETGSL